MPNSIHLDTVQRVGEGFDVQFVSAYVPVATEQELLDFANAVRAIGGAEILPALLPGQTHNATACLIARNLNFNCTVGPANYDDDGFEQWTMTVPSEELAQRIAATLDTRGVEVADPCSVILPTHIGFAAKAFDQGKAFTELSGYNSVDGPF